MADTIDTTIQKILIEAMNSGAPGIVPIFNPKEKKFMPYVRIDAEGEEPTLTDEPAILTAYAHQFLQPALEFAFADNPAALTAIANQLLPSVTAEEESWLFPNVACDARDASKRVDVLIGKKLEPERNHDQVMAYAQRQAAPGAVRGLNSILQQGVMDVIYDARADLKSQEGTGKFLAFARGVWEPSWLRAPSEFLFKPGYFKASHVNLDGSVSIIEGELPIRKRSQDSWQIVELAPRQAETYLGKQTAVAGEYASFVQAALGSRSETWGASNQYAASRHGDGDLRRVVTWVGLPKKGEEYRCGWASGDNGVVRFVLGPSGNLDFRRPALAGAQKISTGNQGQR